MKLRIKEILCVVLCAATVGALADHPQSPLHGWTYDHSVTQKLQRHHELAVLRAQGIQIFIQGESVKIILPNNILFIPNSANLRDDSRPLLNDVSRLIKTYFVGRINVNAYSDDQAWPGAPHDRKLALTNDAAQTVASYLWQSGIDTRLIVAKGNSSQDSVASNATPDGRNFNKRVEITFRFYTSPVAYN